MSNMKNGFSTLNRWLGKKNKDKATPNGKLSKSSTNLSLSVSSTNINETSQLEYNRITPLPVATSNAPFEQTFRITVLLPKDQLYVARLGARVPLSKLLELVCENKQLDAEKYEFRNPVDPSQIYSCDLTIGAVGLSEVRLCHKSETYDNFNADEVIKLHRTSIIRDSLSSSEFSSRHSKHMSTKTASPYSSSNSLNSMDSTGMNYTRTPVGPPPAMGVKNNNNHSNNTNTMNNNNNNNNNSSTTATPTKATKLTAPPRKKRAAPRPPSQTAIPERSPLVLTNGTSNATTTTTTNTTTSNTTTTTNATTTNATTTTTTTTTRDQDQASLPRRKDFHMSTPNLASSTMLSMSSFSVDCNGNNNNKRHEREITGEVDQTEEEEEEDDEVEHRQRNLNVEERNARNLYRGNSVQSLASPEQMMAMSMSSSSSSKFPEPSPRKRILQIKKKAAPAPPPRGSSTISSNHQNNEEEDVEEAESMMLESPESRDEVPRPMAREAPLKTSTPEATHDTTHEATRDATFGIDSQPKTEPFQTPPGIPKPVPRITTTATTTTTLLNSTESRTMEAHNNNSNNNVSKVMLNRTPTPEPRSLSTEPPDLTSHDDAALTEVLLLTGNAGLADNDDDNVSKQADSGIGEPVPSPIPDSLPPLDGGAGSGVDAKSLSTTFESSSDDDDMIKVYNFKLGKTMVKPLGAEGNEGKLGVAVAAHTESEDSVDSALTLTGDESSAATSETSWNFQIPISPPPNFADQSERGIGNPTKSPDAPITPKIMERPVLNFAVVDVGNDGDADSEAVAGDGLAPSAPTTRTKSGVVSPLPSPMNDIVGELSTLINENRMDSLIRRTERDGANEIQAAKPNTLSNFSISSLQETEKDSEKNSEKFAEKNPEKFAEKNSEKIAENTSEKFTEKSEIIIKNSEIEVKCTEKKEQIPMKPSLERETKTSTIPSSPESSPDEEKLYRKRGSITSNGTNILKQRRSVTRADSFHATATNNNNTQFQTKSSFFQNGNDSMGHSENGLNSRSSSYLSLTKLEQQNGLNLQRRRSSSELSIGESPSLQSLEVIKTILNSRKNSLNTSGSDGETKPLDVERLESKLKVVKTRGNEAKWNSENWNSEKININSEKFNSEKINSEIMNSEKIISEKSNSEKWPTNENSSSDTAYETPSDKPNVAPKEVPKVYRYSGPPSINFSTWTDRPKVQVAIKNEGDYIFGGKNSSGQSHAAVTNAAMEFTMTPTTQNPTSSSMSTTTHTMPRSYRASMPAEDFRSLKLRTETERGSVSPTPPPVEPKPLGPTVRMGIPEQEEFKVPITVKPLKDVAVENVVVELKKPPTAPKKPTTATTTKTTTTSVTLVNGGSEAPEPRLQATTTTTTSTSFLATLPRVNHGKRFSSSISSNATLQSSRNSIEVIGGKSATPTTEAATPPWFGQNTLRKTGLKEKILAKEEADLQAKRNGTTTQVTNDTITRSNSTKSPTTPQTTTTTSTATTQKIPLSVATPTIGKMLQSAKLELKLQKSTSVYVNHSSPSPVTATSTPTPATPQSAPVGAVGAPPPPPPMLKPLTFAKPSVSLPNGRATTPQSPDPRDQLLEAIRSFKRDELKRA